MSGPILSKDRQVKEIIKCGKDPVYFVNKYVRIQHPTRGTIAFDTYDFQDDVIRDLQNNRLNIILKSRQLGISTTTAAYALWLALFRRDKNIVCIATKLATAIEFMDKVRVAFASLPKWLISTSKGKAGDSKQHIKFNNGSQVRAIPRSESAGRGLAATLIIIDEAAHIEGFEKIWASLLPAVSTGGSCVMLSSPNGANGVFYKTYVEAIAGKNDFNAIELKWDVHPDRDEKWEQETRRMYSKRYFAQEYDCDFLGSGDTYIAGEDIEWLKTLATAHPPIRRDGPGGQIWIWKEPIPGHNYVISADVARGDGGGDYSAFHIFDSGLGEVVAEFMGHIRPDEFGKLLDIWGRRYNNALMVPELNTYGHHTITVLQHRDYPNMYYEQQERNPHFFPGPDDIPGYNNQGKKKRNDLLANMEAVIRNRIVKTYSTRFIHQLQSFVWVPGKTADSDGKAQAKKGDNDDLIMSFAIGARVLNVGALDESARTMAYALLNATKKSSAIYDSPSQHHGFASKEFAAAFNALDEAAKKVPEPKKQEKSVAPDAEADHGARLPEHIRRRIGGLNWLL